MWPGHGLVLGENMPIGTMWFMFMFMFMSMSMYPPWLVELQMAWEHELDWSCFGVPF